MANGKCPKPIPPLTGPSQFPTPPLNWAVALTIRCFTYGFSPVAAKTHGPLGTMSHSSPGTYEADSLKTQDSPQSFPWTQSQLLRAFGASPPVNKLAAVPSTCRFLNSEAMLATEHMGLHWNHYTDVQLGAKPLERCHAGLWKALIIAGDHAGLDWKPIWKETKISFQRNMLVVIFPVSRVISKRLCRAKKILTFGK